MEIPYSIEELANYIGMEPIPISWKEIHIKSKKPIEWLTLDGIKGILDFYGLKEGEFRKRVIETVKTIQKDSKLEQLCLL